MGSDISRATHPSREYYSCNYRNIPIGIARDTRVGVAPTADTYSCKISYQCRATTQGGSHI